jgi:hypothetical protein
MKFIDLTGRKFSRLTVISLAPKLGKKTKWNCVCECGKTAIAQTDALISGNHRSCGCLHIEAITKHGHSPYKASERSETYCSWLSMKQRCTNPKAIAYHRYGGRGIKYCARWEKFENFLADMGVRPEGLSLDQIDNDRGYEPGNCRWATKAEQMASRSYTPPKIKRPRRPNGTFT